MNSGQRQVVGKSMRFPLRILFFGSPELALPSLSALISCDKIDILAVVTQPDRPAGRGRKLTPPPVKEAALEAGLSVWQPETIRGREFRERIEKLEPDLLVVVAYGHIFRPKLLATPKLGCVNLHFSLLPKYRGAAPINWALINGETRTGVTTMLMDRGMDTGPILLQEEHSIGPDDTATETTRRLASAGATLLIRTLPDFAEGRIIPRSQDHEKASYAPLLKKEDGRIDWSWSADEIFNRRRGLHPWPGIFASFRGEQAKLLEVAVTAPEKDKGEPGSLLIDGDRLHVACGSDSLLEILKIQLPGKRPVGAPDFLHGYRPSAGEKLE